jgi:NNP family nitrate/nitrite transporter-like MFS transporter
MLNETSHPTQTRSEPASASRRTLNLTWLAFFATFATWFDFAPFSQTIASQLHLTKAEVVALGLCNLGLTVPARAGIGMLVDRFGPRRVYACLLMVAAVPNAFFATAHTFSALVISRLALSVVGAGFVVGIRMVAEWFPKERIGRAEGIYAGFGNAGGGAATLGLPILAAVLGGPDGWRLAVALMSVISFAYGLAFWFVTSDTPAGATYQRPARVGALPAGTPTARFGLSVLTLPIAGSLALVAWRLYSVHTLGGSGFRLSLAAIALLAVLQVRRILVLNRPAPPSGTDESKPAIDLVAVGSLAIAYAASFGAELALGSMLPAYMEKGWHLTAVVAGISAGSFALANFFTRPAGGRIADRVRNPRILLMGLLALAALAEIALGVVGAHVSLAVVVLLAIVAGVGIQMANGVNFALVPEIERRHGGQIAGIVGAYGNLGGLVFLTAFALGTPGTFFATTALVAIAAAATLAEPSRPGSQVGARPGEVSPTRPAPGHLPA